MKHLYLPLIALLAACGSNSGAANLAAELDRVQTHLAALEAEYSHHSTAVQGAGRMLEVVQEEDNHQGSMMDHLDTATNEMGDMGQMCQHMQGGARLNTKSSLDTLRQMRTQCQDHRNDVAKSPDLVSARGVEEQHGPTMQSMFDMMWKNMAMMRNEADQFYCGGMHSM